MSETRWIRMARTWLGPVALAAAIVSAGWLLRMWVPAHLREPADLIFVDALRQEARTSADTQKVLRPETDRQTKALVLRRTVYPRLGLVLIVSAGVFVAWMRWLRPAPGRGWGAPAAVLRLIEQRSREAVTPIVPRRSEIATGEVGSLLSALAAAAPQERAVDLSPVSEIVRREGRERQAIIPILQALQTHYRYLPDTALRRVCDTTEITPAQLTAVATFYDQFRHEPVGQHIVRICEGTACHVSGAVEVGNEIRRCLDMTGGGDTDRSGLFTIERVACIGSCSLAPVMTIDEKICGHVSALSAGGVLHGFLESQRKAGQNGNGHAPGRRAGASEAPRPRRHRAAPVEIRIGLGSCGLASGALEVREALDDAVSQLGGNAWVKPVGCSGLCHREPLVEIVQNGSRAMYGNVRPEDVARIVREHVRPRGFIRTVGDGLTRVRSRLLDDRAWVPVAAQAVDASPYLGKQVRVVLENCGQIDPASLDEYESRGGMRALDECLTRLGPQDVIDQVRASGLRGRGGAGFPTGVKWDLARRAPGAKKYVICNGDEGDPGAFMDRAVLEADPFRVIEGLAMTAYAVGADEGFVYVRREYPIAVKHIRAAIDVAEARGRLGANIAGTSFSFTLHVREGAGAFVCGEETALIQSIEGDRGTPRLRPPFPAQAGLWGKPTVINNVETLACLPWILRHGADAFAAMGTEKSKGTKVFSLAGKVNRGGLIEVPMGITIREIVEDIGGGIKDGRSFKAVLCGGPSGGCIPAHLADTRIDYEELASTGAIMGSGGLVVLDDRDCAVDIARYFLHFTESESCGKCTFCRVGTKRMLEILERICAGEGRASDLTALDELSQQVKKGSLCGLGQTAPNPVLTTLRYFREEYEAHIREHRCPAARCKSLIHYTVLDSCTGCTLCAQACPTAAIAARPYEVHRVDDDRCTRCGMCVTACPENSIRVA